MKFFNSSTKKTSRGFTLIELIIVLAVMAILVSWSFPSLQETIRTNRMAAQNNEMLAMLQYARSEAIRRNQSVEVHLEADGTTWDVHIDDPNNDADVEGCQTGQLRCASNSQVELFADTTVITFNNRGYIRDASEAWNSETLYLQHDNCSGPNLRRRIDIMATGQISSCKLACGSLDEC